MKGFTLLEVLVSTTIVAIVMAAIYSALTSNVKVVHIARENSETQQLARIALERMSKDLASAYILRNAPESGMKTGIILEDDEIEGRPADRLDFTSLAHLDLDRKAAGTDLCEIGYFLEEDEENDGFLLYRRDSVVVDDDLRKGGRHQVLALRVAGLDMVFEDAGGETFEAWNSIEAEEEHENALPSLIRVTLHLIDRKGRESVFATGIRPELSERKQVR